MGKTQMKMTVKRSERVRVCVCVCEEMKHGNSIVFLEHSTPSSRCIHQIGMGV